MFNRITGLMVLAVYVLAVIQFNGRISALSQGIMFPVMKPCLPVVFSGIFLKQLDGER